MGEQGEMGEEKRNLGGNHFWQSGGSQSGCVNVCVRVCVFSLFFFVISYSLDVADAQLGPITVYRLLMSSHFDKLLNLE